MKWPSVALADVCEINVGRTPSRNEPDYWKDGVHPWASISDLGKQRFLHDTKERFSDRALRECNMRSAHPGTVLFSFKLSIGKVGIATREMFTNEAIAALPPKDDNTLYAPYLAYALEAIDFSDVGSHAVMGRTLNKKSLSQIEIPLPPLEEQKRIAAILDQADALRRLRRRALDRVNCFEQAIFYEMFGDPSLHSTLWPMGVVGDLLAEAKYGTAEKSNTEKRGLPILRMGNITYDGRLDLSDLKHVELGASEVEKFSTRPGDILFNRTNSKELVGKTAVVWEREPMAIAGYLVRGRVNEDGHPDYISAYLNSPHGKAILKGMCKSIVGMANINAKEFQNIPIALPPYDIQKAFSKKVHAVQPQAEQVKRSLAAAQALFVSLQRRAFRGEL